MSSSVAFEIQTFLNCGFCYGSSGCHMGGKGQGKYRQSYSPYQQVHTGGVSPLASNFNTMMQDLQRLGTMSQLAQQLNRVSVPVTQASTFQRSDPVSLLAHAVQEPSSPGKEKSPNSSAEVLKIKSDLSLLQLQVDSQSSEIPLSRNRHLLMRTLLLPLWWSPGPPVA